MTSSIPRWAARCLETLVPISRGATSARGAQRGWAVQIPIGRIAVAMQATKAMQTKTATIRVLPKRNLTKPDTPRTPPTNAREDAPVCASGPSSAKCVDIAGRSQAHPPPSGQSSYCSRGSVSRLLISFNRQPSSRRFTLYDCSQVGSYCRRYRLSIDEVASNSTKVGGHRRRGCLL
jgi:hypothetical protein